MKDETMTEPSIQFWLDRRDNAGSSPRSSHSGGRAARDLTYDDLDKFKSALPCPRIFIYSRSPKHAIYMLFVDDRVELKQPNSLFKMQGSELSLHIVANRNISERFRLREIDHNSFPGIPLNLEGLHHEDQDLPGFKDVRSLALVFHSEQACRQFAQKFAYLQGIWDKELVSYRHLKDRLLNPRFSIVTRPMDATEDT